MKKVIERKKNKKVRNQRKKRIKRERSLQRRKKRIINRVQDQENVKFRDLIQKKENIYQDLPEIEVQEIEVPDLLVINIPVLKVLKNSIKIVNQIKTINKKRSRRKIKNKITTKS